MESKIHINHFNNKWLFAFMLFIQVFLSCNNLDKKKIVAKDFYTCPMHLQIKQELAGICPICKMDLVEESSLQLHHINVKVDDLIKATNESVLSEIKIIKPIHSSITKTIHAKGVIGYDTRKFNTISSRYKGRIEKLYIRFRFEKVSIGQKLFDIYSPEITTAQQNLIYLESNSSTSKQMIENAKQKLVLLGLTDEQIRDVETNKNILRVVSVYSSFNGYVFENKDMIPAKEEMGKEIQSGENSLSVKEGMYVEAGQQVFKIVNTEEVWALIKVLADDIALVKTNQIVTLATENAECKAKVDLIEPFYEAGNKALNVRIHVANANSKFKINQWVDAQIETGELSGMWVPKTAVLDMGKQKIVFLKKEKSFIVHEVKTGVVNEGMIQVISGIDEQSEIAEHAQYLIDSESFFQTEK
ncbi:MAG: HlyD family efflux transporter periplasmic adaptor subunit [Bacteroidota bacterium]